MVKRLRVFAGPNGSGKSTFIQQFPLAPNIKLGVYINADDIEIKLRNSRQVAMDEYHIKVATDDIQSHFRHSSFAPLKLNNKDLWRNFTSDKNVIHIPENLEVNSYISADLAEFIRQKVMLSGVSFSFETVMSDPGKLDFLKHAKQEAYQVYLYYFCTQDPLININRVKLRVAQNGHNVDEKTIENRYYRSLSLLKKAVLLSHKAYIFDNSQVSELIAEINEGKNVKVIDNDHIPDWFITYLVEA